MGERLFTEPLVQSIGWALVHFVWQGVLIAGAAATILGGMRRLRSTTRYTIACAALALMLAAPVATTLRLWPEALATEGLATPVQTAAALSSTRANERVPDAIGPARALSTRVDVDRAIGLGVFAWLAGVLFLSLRLATGWAGVERLRRQARPPAESLEARVSHLAACLRIARPVRVLESTAIVVPTLVGWIRPAILLPAVVLIGMPPAHLDAILAHELAHVRRNDYLINVLQAVVETLLFYHPAVWWCSRQVRLEREHCCDDLAVAAFGDPIEYATALTNLEERRRNDFRLALAATDGQLLDRVRRLLGMPPAYDGRSHALLLAVAVAVTFAVVAAGTTVKGAGARQTSTTQADVELSPEPTRSNIHNALIHLTARIAHWRGYLFSPQIFRVPPEPPRAPEPPAAPEPTAAPEPPVSPESPQPPEPPFEREPPAWLEPLEPPSGPEPPSAPEPPAAPQAPAAPPAPAAPRAPASPPAPAAPTAPAFFAADSPNRNRSSWVEDGIQTTLDVSGDVTVADDDRDIARISPGGYFIVEEKSARIPRLLELFAPSRREIQLRGRPDGTIDRRYFVGGDEQRFEPEGERWLRELLPRLIRRGGFDAEGRVTRILKREGPSGVAREIRFLESDFVRALYVRLLVDRAALSPADLSQVLQAMEIDSDFEMAQALIAIARTQTIPASAGSAYFRAARTINSDFELRRALSSLLRRPREGAFVRELFATSENINSDFEHAEFLRAAAADGLMEEAPKEFFDALVNVGSDFEHRRVLSSVLRRGRDAATVRLMFQSAGRISGDFEQAEFLRAAAAAGLVEQGRDAFFGAAGTIGSDHERRRVLTAVVERPDVPAETLEAVLRSSTEIGSDFEQAELLLHIARRHRIEGRLRDRMLEVADTIQSEHERGRVLSAVLRSERAAR